MSYDIFQPGAAKSAGVVLNTDLPEGLALQVEVFLGPDPKTKTVTSGKIPFTTPAPGTPNDPVPCPVIMPSAGAIYNAYINLYDANGVFIYGWLAVNQVVVFSGSVGVTWS